MNNTPVSPRSGEIDPGFQPIFIPNPIEGQRNFSVDTLLRLADGSFIAGCQDEVYSQPPCLVRIKPDNSLDTTFGQNGYAFVNVRSAPLAENDGYLLNVDLLPDGRYLTRLDTTITIKGQRVSSLVLACFTADGQKDPAFGNNGLRLYPLPGNTGQWPAPLRALASRIPQTKSLRFPDEQYGDLKVLSDGKLLVLTTVRDMVEYVHRTYVLRLTPDGELDPTFNTDGLMEPESYMWFKPYRLVVQDNGRIVIGGEHPGVPFIARFHENGALDTTFASDGYFTDFGNYAYSRWNTLIPDADGNIVCAGNRGSINIARGRGVLAICKIDMNGQRIPEFNQGATVLIESREPDNAVPVNFTAIVDSSGRIVLGGRHINSVAEMKGFMARLLEDGQPDTRVGADGVIYYEEVVDSLNYIIEDPDSGAYCASITPFLSSHLIYRFVS
ncbi:delta-60 repeat domain-containing protein [Pseudomonas cichorii]|uniref:Delta-60 repeat protein n=1 Tax=Pseudomonas cichorii TaxID=36746 RepID=A0A3M4VGL7_PSECI|nr:delta-60 repeat domain-containing protein [Pseudomonas cichorii]AHF66214.1 hypothetical protein PCH70_10610 [Pseudomonas cichorii JBC1]QVE18169.1 hypothetical protein KGD89_05280 [Pseudomonas cichorii]RMR50986.1 hypothetical protein ALP84_03456 [Pseudomonas cichorii]SDO73065.1 delta-60 repeat domain-containing protein [Pseudomonas cichorii]GFM74916.1 hypothetical protein PSCICM_07350 [Pseudomonas cichorii]